MMSLSKRLPGVRLSLTAGAVALSCVPVTSWAQEATSTGAANNSALEPVVVTATRTPMPLSQVLADTTVISREEIERQAAGSVADLLSHVAGFQISRNGGPGADGNVYLRGSESRHILVLVDGVRVDTQSASGGASWQALSLSRVERIEVVRGPVSALYGSDAVAGVVQIFTRQGQKGPVRIELGAEAGELGFWKADAAVSGAMGLFDYAVSVDQEQSDGFNARANAVAGSRAADRDGYATRGSSVRLGLAPVAGHKLALSSGHQHLDSRYDARANSVADDRAVRDLDTLKAQWSAQWLDNWSSQFSLAQSVDRYGTPLSNYLTQTAVETAAWLNEVKLGAHTVTALAERREDTLQNTDLSLSPTRGEAERSANGLGLGYAWRASFGLALQLNARSDHDSEFGEHHTYGGAIGQDFARHWNVHASYGTGYRTPTLYQRFSRYGKATLAPESSRNAELGLRYHQGSTELGLTAYDNRVGNLISVPTGTNLVTACSDLAPTYCYANTAKAHLRGVSLSGGVAAGPVRLSGSLDFDMPKDALTGKLLRRRARQHASLRADTDVGEHWTLGAQLQASGKRFDDDRNTVVLGGYTVLNLDAQYRFNAQWRALVRIDNVGDKQYQTALNYASAPRTAIVGVRWTPGL